MFTNKQKGYQGEAIVADDYVQRGFVVLHQNLSITFYDADCSDFFLLGHKKVM